ncbi:MAG: hypothetical protein ACXVHX_37520, partial [Solirubrobacteraceae bacterium]
GAAAVRQSEIGDSLPPLAVLDRHGVRVLLSSQLVGETVLLFWNAGCGVCQRLLPALAAWEAARGAAAPELLLIAADQT